MKHKNTIYILTATHAMLFFVMMNLLFTGQFCNLIWGKKYWRHFRNFISSQGRWIDGGVYRGLEDHQIIHTLFASADSGLKIHKKFAKEKKISKFLFSAETPFRG